MKTNRELEQVKKFEPYTKLYRKDRVLFEKIVSQISTFLVKNKGEGETIYVPIKEIPQKKVASALEEYYVTEATDWKQFRIMLDRNWIFAVLTKSETF